MEMETKEDDDIYEDWTTPASPIEVLQQLSHEAVRMASEAWHNRYPGGPPALAPAPVHRHARSEAASSLCRRSTSNSNFLKWKCTMQRALQWGGRTFHEDSQSSFDPEILANQKRQWYQLNSKTLGPEKYKEPTSLFEHFVIVGLSQDAKLQIVEDSFARRLKWNQDMLDSNMQQHWQPPCPILEPQVLFMYPPGKRLALRLKDLATFCFPGGVKVRVLERTPSSSDLNELVYGQEHLRKDDLSFIFSLKVADNATLYGVCLHVHEVVQRPPVSHGASSSLSQSNSGRSRFMVSAPRCYCILTRVPFFELHYEMLNSIIAQERLDRITKVATEMTLADSVPSPPMSKNHINENVDSPGEESAIVSTASATPVDSSMAHSADAAGIISDEEASSKLEYSPGSTTTSDTSDHSRMRELDKDGSKNVCASDVCASETSENGSNGAHNSSQSLGCLQSFESLFSPARCMASEEDDEIYCKHGEDPRDDMIMQWARENKNDLLQIICGYHSMHLPTRGSEIIFQPLEHLQAIEYRRPPVSALGLCDKYHDLELKDSKEASQVKLKLANAEEAVSLSLWSTATLCRVLSLESVLTLITGVLLEKQVVVLCPNLGVLSAVVLSLIPIIRPFEWQSLFLPILPGKMLDFLDAPVPFIVGIQHKLADLKMKTSNLVQVNLVKDQTADIEASSIQAEMKNYLEAENNVQVQPEFSSAEDSGSTMVKTCSVPLLPQHKNLIAELRPIHSMLSCEDSISQRHPVYKCDQVQAEAATKFLTVMRRYMESLCSDLRLHTITSVQSNNDKVSILLKDSFIDSFPVKDQSFIKLFVETQLFSVLSDSQLSSYENE